MNSQRWIASTAVALALASLPAMADDKNMDLNTKTQNMKHCRHADNSRYGFNIEPGENMLFREPVSFTGKVTETTSHNRTIVASNGMTIKVPNQALVWNGDRNNFAQTTIVGDDIVVYLRPDESYRIMESPTTENPWLAVGSYEGVFYLSKDFIEDLNLENLDHNIYSDKKNVVYDEDLKTTK